MKKIFIHAKDTLDILIPEEALALDRPGLLTTIQHLHKLPDIQKKIPGSVIGGQVLGCNAKVAERIRDQVDCFLYIGSGRFHPLQIAYSTEKAVYTLDPASGKFAEIEQADIDAFHRKRQGGRLAYLNAKTIGIIVTTKPGQNRMQDALSLKASIKDRKAYILLGDMMTPNQLEDFNFIDCFVNTACPRINEDRFSRPIINIDDIDM